MSQRSALLGTRRLTPKGRYHAAMPAFAGALGGFARAYQLQQAIVWALRLFAFGLALDAAALGADRLGLWTTLRPVVLMLPPVVGLVVGAALGGLRRPRQRWLAAEVDRRLDLRERTLTALELLGVSGSVERRTAARRPHPSPPHASRGGYNPLFPEGEGTSLQGHGATQAMWTHLAAEQVDDAVAHLRRAEPLDAFPLRLPRREAIAALALAVALVPLFLIGPGAREMPVATNLAEIARGEAERIEALADELEREQIADEGVDQLNAQVAALLHEASEALRDVPSRDAVDRSVARLGDAERRLGAMQAPGAFETAAALSRLADALDREAQTRPVAGALDRREYRQAAEEMQQLGARASAGAEADRRAISDALERGATGAARYDERLAEALREAAQGTGAGDPAATERASQEMGRAGSELRRQEMLERAMSQLQSSRQALGSEQAGSQDQRSDARSSGSGQQGEGEEQGANGGSSSAEQGSGESGRSGQQGEGNGEEGIGGGAGTGSRFGSTDVYDPAAVRQRQVQVPSDDFDRPQVGQGEAQSEEADGEITVDYRSVLPAYEERATRAMQDRYIPLGMKDLVKEYFSSLQGR